MRQSLLLAPLLALAVAGCVPSVAPPPAPAPRPAPAPAPAPTPSPRLTGDWRDWPLTPGDWTYRSTPAGGVSTFAVAGMTPSVTLSCDRATRRLTLVRAGTVPGTSAMTIVTTSQTRTAPAQPDGRGGSAASFAATDNLLDSIGYSRGRFIIQQAGLPTLVIPAWPEIERVTEDCRG
ncbi:MAG: hypothetical protein ACTHM0_06360 [Sphingomonas sp.]